MPSESERVTIPIPPDKIKALHQLVKSGDYTTISDAIRAAIDRFIDVKFAPDYIRKLMIELPKGNVVDLQQLVKSGDSVSVEDAVRNAVREYVRRRLHKAMEGAERYVDVAGTRDPSGARAGRPDAGPFGMESGWASRRRSAPGTSRSSTPLASHVRR